jgi:hypothetical protein
MTDSFQFMEVLEGRPLTATLTESRGDINERTEKVEARSE